jgi:DNA-binding response OmpR family regulator
MTGARILIVDDEEMIADTLSLIFRRQGYEAFTAYNGLLGLNAARDLKPNLVLSDVAMPELDGVNMAMQICNALPEVDVLLFSGQAGTMDLLHDAEERGYHFELLQKPVPPDEIVRKVAAMLANPGHSCHRTVTPLTIDSSPNLP